MTLRLVAWGLLVVLLDLPLNGFDVLPDVAGWVLVVLGLWDLAQRQPLLRRARGAAILATVCAATQFALFFSEQRLYAVRAGVALLLSLLLLATCWWLLAGFVGRAEPVDPAAARQTRRVARAVRDRKSVV